MNIPSASTNPPAGYRNAPKQPAQRLEPTHTRLAVISKRGNRYLRKQLVHGGRSALPGLLRASTPLGAWLRGLMARMHKNAVVIALANKLARIDRAHGRVVGAPSFEQV